MKKSDTKRPYREKRPLEIPIYNDPENAEIPTDVLGSYSGTPIGDDIPEQDVDDL